MEDTFIPLSKIPKLQEGSIFTKIPLQVVPSRFYTEPEPLLRPPPPVIEVENKNTKNLSKYL